MALSPLSLRAPASAAPVVRRAASSACAAWSGSAGTGVSLPAATNAVGAEGELLAGDGDRRRGEPCRPGAPALPSLELVLVTTSAVEGDQAAEERDVAERGAGRADDLAAGRDGLAGGGVALDVDECGELGRQAGVRRGRRAGRPRSSCDVAERTGDRLAELLQGVRARQAGDPGQSRDPRQAGDAGRTFAPVLALAVGCRAVADVAVRREARPGPGSCARSRWCASPCRGTARRPARPRRWAGRALTCTG